MKLRLLTLLLVSFMTTAGFATEVTFSGTILFGPEDIQQPAEGYPVNVYASMPNPDGTIPEASVLTDEDGAYAVTLDLEPTAVGVIPVIIEIFDFCTGEILSQEIEVMPGDVVFENLDFQVCTDFSPPPPPPGCDAFFFYEQVGDDPLTVAFYDLSYSDQDMVNWLWEFGDGTESTEQNPVHEYAEPGVYDVALTVASDSCSSTFIQPIEVLEDIGCVCDDEYDPVCVHTASGQTLVFPNACYAECEGFGPDAFVDCDSTDICVCPEYYDPVCVVGPNGDTIQFSNPCFAECEGYGPDSFVDCGPDDCGCDAFFGPPVCVILDDGTLLHFLNECYALCEGYGPDQFFYCDGPEGCFANFAVQYANDVTDLLVQFEDHSSSTEGEIITWEWNFGDGNTSTEQSPEHEYNEPGIYDVTLTIATEDGCTATITQHICVGIIDDCICPDVFDPVCVQTGAGILFFPNLCEAECAGFTIDDVVDCEDNNCGCPEYYDPVCVVGPNGDIIEFPNICFAECEGYGPDSYVDCENDCNCFLVYDPVCVLTDAGEIITFSNACFAECEGYGEDSFVDCEDDCVCPDIYDPVCVVGADGTIIQFENICFALCEGYGPDAIVDCEDDCFCTLEYDPVCVQTASGQVITFTNACFAECEGYGPDSFVDCENGCDCPEYFDPVCVVGPNGNIIQFDNICFAECEGYGPDSFVDCEDGCVCPDIFDPVCVITGADTLSFVNPCVAECEGFSPEEYFPCDLTDPCGCTLELDPVCVYTAAGTILTFPNPCVAECEGYGPDQYVDCDGNVEDCHAYFWIEQVDPTGLLVNFVDGSETIEGTIESWHWDFGDGIGSEEQNPTHEYAEEGIFEVVLTITTTEGCTSTFVQHVCIGGGGVFDGPECQAMFFFEQNAEDLNTFSFQDMSIGAPTSWTWDFGDGTSSNEQNPVHTYEQPGVYVVTLTISTTECESSVAMLVVSNEDIWYDNQCVALFLPLIIPDSNQVFFLNLSSPDAVSFEWDFGDGTTSNEYIAIHSYEAAGTYEATLTITTADGCTNSFTVTIDLEDDNFTGNPSYLTLTDTEEVEAFNQVRLYPNPAIDDLIIGFEAQKAADYQLDILNANGQLVQRQQINATIGNNLAELDVSQLTPGFYLVRIATNTTTKTMKFIKQ